MWRETILKKKKLCARCCCCCRAYRFSHAHFHLPIDRPRWIWLVFNSWHIVAVRGRLRLKRWERHSFKPNWRCGRCGATLLLQSMCGKQHKIAVWLKPQKKNRYIIIIYHHHVRCLVSCLAADERTYRLILIAAAATFSAYFIILDGGVKKSKSL